MDTGSRKSFATTCAMNNWTESREGGEPTPTPDNLRWHSFALSLVAGFQGTWLKPGQQRSHDPPQVLCWQSHCSLQRER